MQKSKVIVICGPTASGKTALSIELAKQINGEIVSCDSMQIYKDMNIGTAKQEKEEKFIATVACKAAVKANMALDQKEVESLMDKLLSLPNPFTCPHGRPTAIKMTKYDIERKFARK